MKDTMTLSKEVLTALVIEYDKPVTNWCNKIRACGGQDCKTCPFAQVDRLERQIKSIIGEIIDEQISAIKSVDDGEF